MSTYLLIYDLYTKTKCPNGSIRSEDQQAIIKVRFNRITDRDSTPLLTRCDLVHRGSTYVVFISGDLVGSPHFDHILMVFFTWF